MVVILIFYFLLFLKSLETVGSIFEIFLIITLVKFLPWNSCQFPFDGNWQLRNFLWCFGHRRNRLSCYWWITIFLHSQLLNFQMLRELGDSSFKKYKFYYLEWKNNIVILWYMELMTNLNINFGLIDLDLNQTSEFLYVKKDNSWHVDSQHRCVLIV